MQPPISPGSRTCGRSCRRLAAWKIFGDDETLPYGEGLRGTRATDQEGKIINDAYKCLIRAGFPHPLLTPDDDDDTAPTKARQHH